MPHNHPEQNANAYRALIWMIAGRDELMVYQALKDSGIPSHRCSDLDDLCQEIQAGAGVILIAEENLGGNAPECLVRVLSAQPRWSDTPVLVLSSDGENVEPMLETLGLGTNVTLLQFPVRISTLRSTIRSALRARRRQYEVRDLLVKLEEADRQKDLFLATLSHELRTPLTVIIGWVRMILTGKLDPQSATRGLEAIERNAQMQSHLVEDILSMSRIITGKLRVDRQDLDIASIVRDSLEMIQPVAQVKRITIHHFVPNVTMPMEGDPARLYQVIWNLLSNAIKFTPEGGDVYVDLEELQGNARITVRDTGLGIDPQFLPYVFDYFSQADSSYTRGQGGLGLGLALVDHIVRLHGGSVSAVSEGLDKGSTFIVDLPSSFQTLPCAVPALGKTVAINPRVLEGLSILFVEDHRDTREMLVTALERSGARVNGVGSAMEAVRSFRFSKPDLIISDIGLPTRDGYQLMEELVALQKNDTRRVPAIALTGYVSPDDRRRALEVGYSLHLAKPIDDSVLISHIIELLDKRSRFATSGGNALQ